MRKIIKWLKAWWPPITVLAVIAILIIQPRLPDRRGSDHEIVPGTVAHPATMGNMSGGTFLEEGDPPWRYSEVSDVVEAPLADGYTEGRCFVERGHVSEGFSPFAPDGDHTLTITYAANGVILATGDSDLPCNAEAIERSLVDSSDNRSFDDRLPFDEVAESDGGYRTRHFVHVTYVLGDAEPDAVVLTAPAPEAGSRVPGRSSVFAFKLENPDRGYLVSEAWNEIFGLSDEEGGA